MARPVQNVRVLGDKEISIAKTVFKNTIPYDKVVISDALGKDDAPFTMPTSMPTTPYYNVKSWDGGSYRKYVMHVGDGYYGMSQLVADKRLLIHELTHVRQGEHSSWSWGYVFDSAMHRVLSEDEEELYGYDKNIYEPWESYNAEQQASIVEDWFADGMKEFDPDAWEGDKRFYYVKKYIRGEHVPYDVWRPTVRPLPAATLDVQVANHDAYFDRLLLPILTQNVRAGDISKAAEQVRQLAKEFRDLRPVDAQTLLWRLERARGGDNLVQTFNYRLDRASRRQLLEILKQKVAGPVPASLRRA